MTGTNTTILINGTPHKATFRITEELLQDSLVDLNAIMGHTVSLETTFDVEVRYHGGETEENGKARAG